MTVTKDSFYGPVTDPETLISELQDIEKRLQGIRKSIAESNINIKKMGEKHDFKLEFNDEMSGALVSVGDAMCIVSKYYGDE